jgi:6-phosphogluconolactonase (cycloisomerase 2 family)
MSMRSGCLWCVAVLCSLVFLLSCGGSSGKSATLYLVSQGTDPGSVSAYSVSLKNGTIHSSNGALTPDGKEAATGTQPSALLFDPTQSFAYVANTVSNNISTFTVSKDGSLTAGSTTDAGKRPVALAMDPGAHFLFVANEGVFVSPTDPTQNIPGSVSVFSIGSGGALTEVAGSPFVIQETSPPLLTTPNQPQPESLAVSNQGNFLYLADRNNGTVVGYAFDSTTGVLSPVPGQAFPAGSSPSVVFSPAAGNFLYVANAGSNDIFAFSVNGDGSLSAVTTSGSTTQFTISTGIGPIALLSDPGAKYIFALANGGSQITGYTMNHVTGLLTAVVAATASTGANPVAFTIRSDGSKNGDFWIFTSNFGGNSVSTFKLTYATGALNPVPQLTAPLAPYGIGIR